MNPHHTLAKLDSILNTLSKLSDRYTHITPAEIHAKQLKLDSYLAARKLKCHHKTT